MKKFVNAIDTVLSESLSGFAAAHSLRVILGKENKFVRRARLTPGKVALISGGGSGHEPLHAGFVGYGMLDAGPVRAKSSHRPRPTRWPPRLRPSTAGPASCSS